MTNETIIRKTKNILNDKGNNLPRFDTISKIYPRTNENITDTYNLFDLQNKDILTVISSSDHIFCAILNDINSITSFDLNILTKYYYHLKKALIETYDLNKFKKVLFDNLIDKGILKEKTYLEFRDKIDKEYRDFWDEIINYSLIKNIPLNKLFLKTSHNIDLVNYLKEENYKLLKEKIESTDITFIQSDITLLHKKLEGSYDYMFLSNISDYLTIFKTKQYAETKLLNHLNKNGQIAYAYMFGVPKHIIKRYQTNNVYQVDSSIQDAKDYVLTIKR